MQWSPSMLLQTADFTLQELPALVALEETILTRGV
jgi:hypothetical protein